MHLVELQILLQLPNFLLRLELQIHLCHARHLPMQHNKLHAILQLFRESKLPRVLHVQQINLHQSLDLLRKHHLELYQQWLQPKRQFHLMVLVHRILELLKSSHPQHPSLQNKKIKFYFKYFSNTLPVQTPIKLIEN